MKYKKSYIEFRPIIASNAEPYKEPSAIPYVLLMIGISALPLAMFLWITL